jgi:hypothetical protein
MNDYGFLTGLVIGLALMALLVFAKKIVLQAIRLARLLWKQFLQSPLAGCAWLLVLVALGWRIVHDLPNKDIVLAADARKHAGETKHVLGKVCQIKRVREGKVLVDFGDAYPKQSFTAVFTPQAYKDVCEEQGEIKVGGWLAVHGIIDLYDGRPEIRVYDELDVHVNQEDPDYSPE